MSRVGKARSGLHFDRTVTADLPAPPDAVWELLVDLPRMGEWSPECDGCEWVGGSAGPSVGARFTGNNSIGLLRWSTEGEIEVFEPARELVYVTRQKNRDMTRWRYHLEPSESGTRVTESFETVDTPVALLFVERLIGRPDRSAQGMRTTLEALGAAAARSAGLA